VTFAERPKPSVESPHDVLVAVNYTGICGSDVHYWVHGAIGHFVVREPMVLGHESAGTVVETGAAVAHLRPGDRVAIEPGYGCRRCAACRAGKYNLCEDMIFAATPPHDFLVDMMIQHRRRGRNRVRGRPEVRAPLLQRRTSASAASTAA